MSSVLSNDPLTVRLQSLARIPASMTQTGAFYGSRSQRDHAESWNATDGIRAQAFAAGGLSGAENDALSHALLYWAWLPESDRRDVNRVVTMLFYIRRNNGFENFDRNTLSTIPQFQIKPPKTPKPRELWNTKRTRRQRDRERGTFATL